MIQLHRLEGFYRVVLAGGYTRAAKTFPYPITQPGVQLQVRRLEDDLGVRLVQRAGRDRVVPTTAGERLFDFCSPFFQTLPSVVDELAKGRYGGVLRIDAAALEIRHVLPTWLRRLASERPDIHVDLSEVETPDLDRLTTRRADLVVEVVPEIPAAFSAKHVGIHHVFLVVPASFPIAKKKKKLGLADLRGERLITFHPSLPQAELQLSAVAQVAVPRKVMSASTTEGILGFVAAGLGYSLVPWPSPAGPVVRGVRAQRLTGPRTEFPIVAVWRKQTVPNPLVEAALACSP